MIDFRDRSSAQYSDNFASECPFVYNKTGFSSKHARFFSEYFKEKSGTFSFGKLRWARRAELEPSPGRAGSHWNLPGSAVAHMVGGPCRHGSFNTNVQTPSTAMPPDRRIAQSFIQIQVGSEYFKMVYVSQIIFACFVDTRIVLCFRNFSPARPQMSTGSGSNSGPTAALSMAATQSESLTMLYSPLSESKRRCKNPESRDTRCVMSRSLIFLYLLSISVLARVIF